MCMKVKKFKIIYLYIAKYEPSLGTSVALYSHCTHLMIIYDLFAAVSHSYHNYNVTVHCTVKALHLMT